MAAVTVFVADFRCRDRGGAVTGGRLLDRSQVLSALSGASGVPVPQRVGDESDLLLVSRLVVLIHGYNVSRSDGLASLLRLAHHLEGGEEEGLVAILWPGDHWTRALSYSFEGRDADDTADRLAAFLSDRLPFSMPLSFLTHSLGARVTMEAIPRLVRAGFPVHEVCFFAAAIDDFSLAARSEYREATRSARRVSNLASRKDRTLRLAYPVGDLLQAFIFFWKDEPGAALGFHGPRPHKGSRVPETVFHHQIPDDLRVRHRDYVPGPSPNAKQRSALSFAKEALSSASRPHYPDPG